MTGKMAISPANARIGSESTSRSADDIDRNRSGNAASVGPADDRQNNLSSGYGTSGIARDLVRARGLEEDQ